MSDVILRNVNKIYPNGVQAVFDFNIEIEHGEFIVLAGPSGCGKSTTLRMIAGLEEITSGDLIINNKRVNDVAPRDRDIAMVFQNYALYAHMTVYNNLAFSLLIRKVDEDEIHRRVMAAAEILGLVPYLNRKPKQLSGGQRQRVAVGRAIVRNPIVFLLDEPLSNLDAKLRGTMRKELMLLHNRLNATFVYVTHDQIEALTLASRIVVMADGRVQQIATPKEMFDNPENLFVAGFIGTPPMNFFHGEISEDGYFIQNLPDEYNPKLEELASLEENKENLSSDELEKYNSLKKEIDEASLKCNKIKIADDKFAVLKEQGYIGKQVVMASRPEYVYLDDAHLVQFKDCVFDLDSDLDEMLGAYSLVYGKFGHENIIAKVSVREVVKSGEKIKACFDNSKLHFFDVDTTRRIRAEEYVGLPKEEGDEE